MTQSQRQVPDDARVNVRLDELIALHQHADRMRLTPASPASPSAGDETGHRRGRGMDYLESRAYQAGDDVRHLDWRLTARSGSLHTKVFQEEYEHRVTMIIDCHAGMHFGTRDCFKSVCAARAAALIAWQVAQTGGRVGALAFGPCRQVQRALAGQRGALAVCAALVRWDAASAQTDAPEPLSMALRRMRPLLRGTSHAVLITDGRSGDAGMHAALAMWRRRMRLSVLLVTDPLETQAPPRGWYPVDCAEHRFMLDLVGESSRDAFRRALGAPAGRLRQACHALGIVCRDLDGSSEPRGAVAAILGKSGRGA
ncbi:MAG TPA: DUF58 domain-containing protein [Rhodanobacteraceae bacterium]